MNDASIEVSKQNRVCRICERQSGRVWYQKQKVK